MNNESQLPRISHCPNCKGQRNCRIIGSESSVKNFMSHTAYEDWFLLSCLGCETIFSERVEYNDSSGNYIDLEDGKREFSPTIKTSFLPPYEFFEIPNWIFGSELAEARFFDLMCMIEEVYSALNSGSFALGCIGIRTCFDLSTELLGCEDSKTFAQKLDFLLDNNFITTTDRERLDILVEAGHAATHRKWKPNLQDTQILISELERFIFGAFVFEKSDSNKRAMLAALKNELPSKQSKKP